MALKLGAYLNYRGRKYRVLAFYSSKRDAETMARKQRKIGYYKSVIVVKRSLKDATHKYWVFGSK